MPRFVILQAVVGRQYGDYYYPNISGVLRSLNYYPIGDEKAEEGIASLALGLGKYIVDGGQTLRVSPYHPDQVLQTSEMDIALRQTQTKFYALDTTYAGAEFKVDDGFNIKTLKVKDADCHFPLQQPVDTSHQSPITNPQSPVGAQQTIHPLNYIASTFDAYDQVIRDGLYDGGRKVISFCGVLQQGVFPLPEILQMSMTFGQEAMRRPVEIEFACNLSPDRSGEFYLLQIRPIVDSKQMLEEDLTQLPDDGCLLRSHMSLGHGIAEDVCDVVYVKTGDDFTAINNPTIADEIERVNRDFLAQNRQYVLVGPGRWGSSDPWLGIPVKWPHISAARVIVEEGLANYRVDPSQGTHFFQNLTSFGVGYFTINPYKDEGIYRRELLDSMPAGSETKYIRHVRFDRPL